MFIVSLHAVRNPNVHFKLLWQYYYWGGYNRYVHELLFLHECITVIHTHPLMCLLAPPPGWIWNACQWIW